jgi:glutamine amidotransferase-like uncharacterized protein
MLGGADLPYCRLLNGNGNEKISSFVYAGGHYLGICAGSYYAGAFVEFAKGTDLEVLGKRELSFFPGVVQGPTFSPFAYSSTVGMRLVKLFTSFSLEPVFCFYQGGGHFCLPEQNNRIEVIARYSEAEGQPPAIVHCSVGKGSALLSGVHFEYDPNLMKRTPHFSSKNIEEMRKSNKMRLLLVKKIFERFT